MALIFALTGHFKEFLIFSVIIFVHEMGHVLTAIFFKWKIEKVLFLPFGALTIFDEYVNRPLKEEWFILFMGPFFQLIFTFIFKDYENVWGFSFAILFFNLLPIFPLDGSKFLNIFLCKFLSFKKSFLWTIYISFLTIFGVLIHFNFNLILILILSFLLKRVIYEFYNAPNLFNKFLLERYMYKFNFFKRCFIKGDNLSKMKRDYKHIFIDNGFISEDEMLKRKFLK